MDDCGIDEVAQWAGTYSAGDRNVVGCTGAYDMCERTVEDCTDTGECEIGADVIEKNEKNEDVQRSRHVPARIKNEKIK